MARYQVGASVYEIPDNVQGQQLNNILGQLAAQEKQKAAPSKPKDGAFGYSVDQAQRLVGKGIEVAGNLVGSETVADYGTSVVEQQDKDIAEGGYQPTYTGNLDDTYAEQGVSGALGWIVEKSLENAATGGAAIAGTAAAGVAAVFSAPAALIIGGGTFLTTSAMGAGGSAFEQEEKTGEYNAAVATGVGLLSGILDRFGAGKVIPSDKLAKMTGEEVVGELMKAGKTEAAEAVGKRITKSTLAEAGTETAQEGLQVASAMSQGGEYTADELKDRALEAAVLGGTMGGTVSTGIETAKGASNTMKTAYEAMTSGEPLTPEQEAARGDFARRLAAISEDNGWNLKDLSPTSTKGARATVDKAHSQITTKISELRSTLRSQLNIKDTDSEALADLKTTVRMALKDAATKTKTTVSPSEFDAVAELVGDTKEGQQLLKLFRESNELTELHNSGLVGGVSQYTDILSPLTSGAGYDRGVAFTERLARPMLSTSFAYQTGGASLAAQAAVSGAGRAIDAVTGRRSRVANFIKDNQGNTGQGASTGRSIRAERKAQKDLAKKLAQQEREKRKAEAEAKRQADAKKAAEQKAMNIELYNNGTRAAQGYTPDSPQDLLLRATGLNLGDLQIVLNHLANNPVLKPSTRSATTSLREGGQIQSLNELIRSINNAVDNGEVDVKLSNPRDTGAETTAQSTTSLTPRQMGIEANRKFANDLIAEIAGIEGISEPYKQQIVKTLETLRDDDLGSDPVKRAEKELDKLLDRLADDNLVPVDPEQMQKASQIAGDVVGRYIERVKDQQQANKNKTKSKSIVKKAPKKKQATKGKTEAKKAATKAAKKTKAKPVLSSSTDSSTIKKEITQDSLKTRAQVNKELSEQTKEASKDPRYDKKGNKKRYSEKAAPAIGNVKFSKKWDDETVSLIATIKPELDEISKMFNIPNIRAVYHFAYNAFARMGSGMLYLDAAAFNKYAAGFYKEGLDANQVAKEVEKLKDQIELLTVDHNNLRTRYMDFIHKSLADNGIKNHVLSSLPDKTLKQVNDMAAEVDASAKNISKLRNRLAYLSQDNSVNWQVSSWKQGDGYSSKPQSTSQYFDKGVDVIRKVLYHEIGHHVHQMFASTDAGTTSYPLEDYAEKLFNQDKSDSPSKYGMTNHREWFAENFCLYFMGKKELVSPRFIKMIEYVLDKGAVPNE